VRGGEKPNVIPAEAECQMIFRTVIEPEIVQAKLQSIIARHGGTITAYNEGGAVFDVLLPMSSAQDSANPAA